MKCQSVEAQYQRMDNIVHIPGSKLQINFIYSTTSPGQIHTIKQVMMNSSQTWIVITLPLWSALYMPISIPNYSFDMETNASFSRMSENHLQ